MNNNKTKSPNNNHRISATSQLGGKGTIRRRRLHHKSLNSSSTPPPDLTNFVRKFDLQPYGRMEAITIVNNDGTILNFFDQKHKKNNIDLFTQDDNNSDDNNNKLKVNRDNKDNVELKGNLSRGIFEFTAKPGVTKTIYESDKLLAILLHANEQNEFKPVLNKDQGEHDTAKQLYLNKLSSANNEICQLIGCKSQLDAIDYLNNFSCYNRNKLGIKASKNTIFNTDYINNNAQQAQLTKATNNNEKEEEEVSLPIKRITPPLSSSNGDRIHLSYQSDEENVVFTKDKSSRNSSFDSVLNFRNDDNPTIELTNEVTSITEAMTKIVRNSSSEEEEEEEEEDEEEDEINITKIKHKSQTTSSSSFNSDDSQKFNIDLTFEAVYDHSKFKKNDDSIKKGNFLFKLTLLS
jgi:hypothetical protein